jgi:RsiW-degrading membrane proteinase PrsW (M82 family)
VIHPQVISRSRVGRYGAAALVAAVVLAVLVVSALLDYKTVRAVPGRAAIIGLTATALAAVATVLFVRAFEHDAARRMRRILQASVLFGLAALAWLLILDTYLFTQEAGPDAAIVCALACLPTTAFGLWVMRRLDRYEPEPWALILLAAAWGGIVATCLVVWFEGMWESVSAALLVPGPGLEASNAFSAGLFEETAKGTAVLLLFLTVRSRFDDVVDGIVYGAAVGLGFNFLESIAYMTNVYAIFGPGSDGPTAAAFQWYARQVLGLFFGHATYTALIGAGIGVARQLAPRRQAVIAILCGWLVAMAAHFAWDAWLTFFPISRTGLAILEVHLRTLVMTGPFTAAVAVLLVLGLARESINLRRQMELEAASGSGAIWPAEVPLLISPWQRLRARLGILGRFGFGAYRNVTRLQRAQLNLAMARWHAERHELESPLDDLRTRVMRLKAPPA